jgi:hypothetical protein
MTVRFFLVTASLDDRMALWSVTLPYANWIDGCGPEERETWLVTCLDRHSPHFFEMAEHSGATVEEIDHTDGAEKHVLRVGAPGTGWEVPSGA